MINVVAIEEKKIPEKAPFVARGQLES